MSIEQPSLITMVPACGPSSSASCPAMPGAPNPHASPAQVCAEAVSAYASLQGAVLRGQVSVDVAVDAWTTYVRAVGTVPGHKGNDSVTAVLATLFSSLQALSAVALVGNGMSPRNGSTHHLDEGHNDTPSPPARGRLRARTANSSPHCPLSTSGSTPIPALVRSTSGGGGGGNDSGGGGLPAPQPHTPGALDDGEQHSSVGGRAGGSFRRQASPGVPQISAPSIDVHPPSGGLLFAPPQDMDLQGGLGADECEGFKLE